MRPPTWAGDDRVAERREIAEAAGEARSRRGWRRPGWRRRRAGSSAPGRRPAPGAAAPGAAAARAPERARRLGRAAAAAGAAAAGRVDRRFGHRVDVEIALAAAAPSLAAIGGVALALRRSCRRGSGRAAPCNRPPSAAITSPLPSGPPRLPSQKTPPTIEPDRDQADDDRRDQLGDRRAARRPRLPRPPRARAAGPRRPARSRPRPCARRRSSRHPRRSAAFARHHSISSAASTPMTPGRCGQSARSRRPKPYARVSNRDSVPRGNAFRGRHYPCSTSAWNAAARSSR